MAPTYRNDSTTQTWRGLNFSGEVVNVPPGHSIVTQNFLLETFMTKTADTPYWSPTIEWAEVRSSGETKTKTVNADLMQVLEVYNRAESSGEVDIKFNSASSNIEARLLPGRAVTFAKADVQGKVSSVIFETLTGFVADYLAKKQ